MLCKNILKLRNNKSILNIIEVWLLLMNFLYIYQYRVAIIPFKLKINYLWNIYIG